MRYERDPDLLKRYREWLTALWDMNWMEGNSLFTFMTLALDKESPHREESLKLALDTLRLFPVDRVFRPVMNSLRKDIEQNSHADRQGSKQSAHPLPVNVRPLDNEYTWKGNPYQLDAWFKPIVTAFEVSCDDPLVAWFTDSNGRIYMTRDGWKSWSDLAGDLMGARVKNITASKTRTLVLHADTDKGAFITRDGGMSWRTAREAPAFPKREPVAVRSMKGWRIPIVQASFQTPRGVLASGPGGAYLSTDGENWTELKLWHEDETGAADYLHAYWMGRHYGFVK
jgi:hypothetical protein